MLHGEDVVGPDAEELIEVVSAAEVLVLAQEPGGAIRGAVRGDFFLGFGDEAGREAGRMRQEGRIWILWPRRPARFVAPAPIIMLPISPTASLKNSVEVAVTGRSSSR